MPLRSSKAAPWIQTLHGPVDPKWKAVDDYAFANTHPTSRPNTVTLQETLQNCAQANLPDYALSPSQAKFLALHCKAARVSRVLEIGTLGGYSAIWMASENPQLRITTIEFNPANVAVARLNLKRAGLADRVEVLLGEAEDVLLELREEVRTGKRERFAFVFVDADKRNNWRYFQLAREMVPASSVICVDNVVRLGQLADGCDRDPDVVASRHVLEEVGRLAGVDSVVLQTVGEKELRRMVVGGCQLGLVKLTARSFISGRFINALLRNGYLSLYFICPEHTRFPSYTKCPVVYQSAS